MTSLATLAHTVSAPPPFNGLFYATAATIIPVLFLAIAVQGRGYESLLEGLVTRGRQGSGAFRTLTALFGRQR
jgi:hypothetical protein